MNLLYALVCASAAAGLWVRPHRALRRLEPQRVWRPPRWLAGRPGAWSLRRRVWCGAGAAAAFLVVMGPGLRCLALTPLVAAAVAIGLGFVDVGQEARRREAVLLVLPGALELMAASLEAGTPLRVATRELAATSAPELRAEFDMILARSDIGESDAEAWAASRERPVIGPVARDVARSVTSGATLLRCLRRHAEQARGDRQGALEARARAVGVKSVLPMTVCSLPAFILVGVVPVIAGVLLTLLP